LRAFRTRFGVPIADSEIGHAPFYRPSEDSIESKYMLERRRQLGGFMPARRPRSAPLAPLSSEAFEEFFKGTEGRKASTTMGFLRLPSQLLRPQDIGRLFVP